MLKMIGAILISFVVVFVCWTKYEHETNLSAYQAHQHFEQQVKTYHEQCDLDSTKYEHDKAWQDHQDACTQMKRLLDEAR
jgi:hypothetical protein